MARPRQGRAEPSQDGPGRARVRLSDMCVRSGPGSPRPGVRPRKASAQPGPIPQAKQEEPPPLKFLCREFTSNNIAFHLSKYSSINVRDPGTTIKETI